MGKTLQLDHPFGTSDVQSIALAEAPLERVFAQVRWQEISALKSDFDSCANKLAIAVSGEYPFRTDSTEVNVLLTPDGPQQQAGGKIVQLRSADENWRVYFTATFLTLETTKYVDLEDMIRRFSVLLVSLTELVAIPTTSRLGFRYMNRISDPEDFGNIDNLVRPEVNGGLHVPTDDYFSVGHSLTESLFVSENGSLLAKWATLPPGAVLDQSIEPVQTKSWVLDLDAFHERPTTFDTGTILRQLKELSLIGYRFFRWSVEDKFFDRFGGAK